MNNDKPFPFPRTTVTYKGRPLTQAELESDPALQRIYPSMEEFLERWYKPLLAKARATGEEQHLEVSEHGIRINGEFVHRTETDHRG